MMINWRLNVQASQISLSCRSRQCLRSPESTPRLPNSRRRLHVPLHRRDTRPPVTILPWPLPSLLKPHDHAATTHFTRRTQHFQNNLEQSFVPVSISQEDSSSSIDIASAAMAQESLRLVCHPVAAHEGRLPRQYTLEGQGAKKDISPPLEWYGVPDGTRSLALVVQDIDAPEPERPVVPWTHWVVANISPEIKGLPEGFSGAGGNASTDSGVQEGINDWKQPGWRGPVPDSHGHRIQFRIYALDDELSLGNKVTAAKVMDAIEGHVLAEAELTAVFNG